tara:strand:+ start:2740 stop:3705 length:966 start_codon:yes stop_codon:yes gene_type:complete
MSSLEDKIKSSRKIKENSLKIYMTTLKKIYRTIHDDTNYDSKLFNSTNFLQNKHYKKIIEFLSTLRLPTRKNYLSAILVALTTNKEKNEKIIDEYRNHLDVIVTEYTGEINSQKKSEKLETNWTSFDAIKRIVNRLKRDVKENNLLNKSPWSNKDLELYKLYMVGSLYTLIPPVRNDYAQMKVLPFKTYNKLDESNLKDNNYLVIVSKSKKFFSFGAYKTSEVYGVKISQIPPSLNKIINIWLTHQTTDYFLNNSKNEPITDNGLTKLINKVFSPTGKKIGSTMLRHIYLSDKYEPLNAEKAADAEAMMHSVSTQNDYIKK